MCLPLLWTEYNITEEEKWKQNMPTMFYCNDYYFNLLSIQHVNKKKSLHKEEILKKDYSRVFSHFDAIALVTLTKTALTDTNTQPTQYKTVNAVILRLLFLILSRFLSSGVGGGSNFAFFLNSPLLKRWSRVSSF